MSDIVNTNKTIISNTAVYGLAHATVDAICIGLLFSAIKHGLVAINNQTNLIIIYSVVAFGPQVLFGLLIDRVHLPRLAALIGLVLVGGAALFYLSWPVTAIVIAAVGNAIFHVGAGSISLNLIPKKAAIPGIFVAPRAFGVFLGTLLGKGGNFIAWPFVLTAGILIVTILLIKKPATYFNHTAETEKRNVNYLAIIVLLVFLSIAIRSLVGFIVVFPWKIHTNLLITLTLAIVAGKALGGILADKFGWIKIAVGALIVSIPFLAFGANYPALAIPGMLLFNMTMPITLVAISNVLPGRPAFAFGLTCLALIIGVLPIYAGWGPSLQYPMIIFTVILFSAAVLYAAFKRYQKKESLAQQTT